MKLYLLRLLLCLALLASICNYSLADKITTDPNVPGASALKPNLRPDARLAQTVTYEARYRPVQTIVEDLSEMTGVKLHAGAGKSDWIVRSRKMNIFVKDVKMADLMDSIAHVMKFRWIRNDEVDPPTYRLVVDKKAAASANTLMKKALDAREQMWQTRRDEWIEAIDKYGKMSDSELETLRQTDPLIYRYTRYGAVQALRVLFDEVPETKKRFASGQSFRISASSLSDRTRSVLYAAGEGYWKYLQKTGFIAKLPDGSFGYGDSLKADEKYDIAYMRMDEVGGFTPGMRWGGQGISAGYFHLMEKSRDFEMADLRAINENACKLACYFNNCFLDDREPDRNEIESYATKAKADRKKEEESLYPSEPLIQHEPWPELDRDVKFKIEPPGRDMNPALALNDHIASFQKALAAATGLGVVSDSWVTVEGNQLSDQDGKLTGVLDKLATEFNYNWDFSSGVLEFRHRLWWKKRLNQIPDEWVTAWSENTWNDAMVSLDDLAAMSNLNYYQMEESFKADRVLGSRAMYRAITFLLDLNVHWLRLYSSLGPQLRTLLMSERGINGNMLTADQWKQAQAVFDRIGTSRGEAVFRMEQTTGGGDKVYRFVEIDTETGEVDREWKLPLPRLQRPIPIE